MVDAGMDVTIFASGFSHVTGREERLRRGALFRVELVDGVRFVWLRTSPYRGNGWRRQLNMLSFVATFLAVQARFPKPSALVGSTVHPFAALGAWLVARLRGARFVFEVRDLWPQTLVDLGAMRAGSPGERLLRTIEAFLVRHAASVVTLLPGMRTYLQERGLPADHVVYLPNGVDLAAFDRAAADPAASTDPRTEASLRAIKALRDDGRLVAAYVGALGRVNALDVVIDAVRLAEERGPGRVGLVIIGDGPERPALERAAAGTAAIAMVAPVPKRLVPRVLRAIDVGIVHATDNPVYRYGISFNKLFEYLAAGRPVVFACTSAYDPVAEATAGISLAPNDPASLAEALIAMSETTLAERAAMGAAGRALVERDHDIRRLAANLVDVVTSPAR
jgi:glycosyltransferase involved in cell wall biosynthesis